MTPNEKLATSLAVLRKLQSDGRRVLRSRELPRVHRERLVRQGFLQEIMKGWLISTDPSVTDEDSTPWYASFWEFCAQYCTDRFGDEWHLSPEQSLLLLAENTTIPPQVIIYSSKGTNNTVQLLFKTSLFDLKLPRMPPSSDLMTADGVRLVKLAAAIVKVPEAFFVCHPIEAQVALSRIRDASDVLGRLLEGGHSVVAGRLAGAFRRIGRSGVADEILSTMKAAGYSVRETDPFAPQQTFTQINPKTAPIVDRCHAMWNAMREAVIDVFPTAPGLPKDRSAYLHLIDDVYQSDAYHSLSIEGYRVTQELIERVQSGAWNPDTDETDNERRNALAARGYWQSFQLVKASVAKTIEGENPGALVSTTHRDWYRELFQPCVAAGIIPPTALAGYRNDAVYLRRSRHVPPRWESVRDAMPALFDLIEAEPEPSVRAVLGHWLFGYIHPYPDGNGRMARFLMNVMLASGGYPWTVIRVEDRADYLAALESASVAMDIQPFAQFVAERVRRSMDKV